MPRPKGSKNKKKEEILETVDNNDESIAAVEAAIAALTEELKGKKAELKQFQKAKAKAEKAASEKKAEADKQTILEAVANSGKSVEEILELLK